LARHYLHSAAIPGAERGVPYAIAVADDAAARYARHEELAALRTALELLEPHDDRTITLQRRLAEAAVLAQIDPEEQLTETDAAGRLVADEAGADAACDFVTELVIAARYLDDIQMCWHLAALARHWLRAERRDREWAILRDTELSERSYHDPLAPGIPTDDDDYRELRSVIRTLPPDDEERFVQCGGPGSRREAEAQLARKPQHIGALWGSGAVRDLVRAFDVIVERNRRERLVAGEAVVLALQSRFQAVLGEFDASAASLDGALALMPRIAPESNATLQVLGAPILNDFLAGVDQLPPGVVDLMLGFANRPDTHWAGLVLRLGAARALAMAGDEAAAVEILDTSIAGIERAAAWAVNAPLVFALAAQIAWVLERTEHLIALERNVREKWLEPNLCYPGVDSRWHVALLCALDGRVDEAREWFAESRRVLLEQESEPVIVSVDYDAALMELRLGADGDPERFAECIAAARARCTHPAMAAWLPRLDALESRAAAAF
jgi:hypothetical protein